MDRCDRCRHQDGCVCVPYGCENFDFDLSKHDAKVRADAIDEFMDKLPYSAMVRMSTIKEIAEQLKGQNNGK